MIDHRINQSASAAHFLHRFKALKSSSRKKWTLIMRVFRSAINEDRLSSLPDNSKFSPTFLELNVVIFPKRHHEFPPCLFSSNKSLKHFTLRSFFLPPCLIHKTPWDFPPLTTLFTNSNFKLINLIAPKLENLTVINCSIEKLNAPPLPSSLSEYGLHSLNKVAIYLPIYRSRKKPYEEEVACKTINMVREVHSARFLTLNADVVECISSFPELISHHPSPFKNLICIKIDTGMRKDAYKVKMSTEARNFLLENPPSATFIMEIPEAPNFEKAKMVANFGSKKDEVLTIISKKDLTRSLLEKLPKRQRTEIVARYSRQLEELGERVDLLLNKHLTSKRTFDAYEKFLTDNISTFLDVSSSNIPLVSRPSSPSFAISQIPTLSTSNINSMP